MAARERADIILHRPPYNVIAMTARDQLRAVIEALDADERVRVIVLRLAGRAFLQRRRYQGLPGGFARARLPQLAWNVAAPARCSKPVIAANRGYCFGVGFELSLACDFRIATETTQYALPEQKLGQIPGSGGLGEVAEDGGHWPHQGHCQMRSRRISGKQAYEWGIAVECVADAELEAATDALVDELRGFAAGAAHRQKAAQRHRGRTAVDRHRTGRALHSRLRSSDDFREGVEAFHGKRKPAFRGS
ncbi:enoyl-CoA hydratase/isomerase family protein [Cupriavidus basilensis]